jgi:hypothetical protein
VDASDFPRAGKEVFFSKSVLVILNKTTSRSKFQKGVLIETYIVRVTG